MPRVRPAPFTFLGALFLAMGLLTALSILSGWHFNSALSWHHWVYAALDLLLAYGFFAMQKWVLPIMGLTAASNVLFFALPSSAGVSTAALAGHALLVLAAAAITYYLYTHQRRLRLTQQGRVLGVLCAAAWLSIFCYTIGSIIS